MATWDAILSPISLIQNIIRNLLTQLTLAFRPNSNCFLHQDYNHVLTTTNTLYDFPISVELTYLDVLSTRRQLILFSKYNNFLSLYNHSGLIKMHMHNAWLLGKFDLTIIGFTVALLTGIKTYRTDYFTKPKYLFVFCGTLILNQIWDNGEVNTLIIIRFCLPLRT